MAKKYKRAHVELVGVESSMKLQFNPTDHSPEGLAAARAEAREIAEDFNADLNALLMPWLDSEGLIHHSGEGVVGDYSPADRPASDLRSFLAELP